MKRIIIFLVAVISFCFCAPQAEAVGGAAAIIFVDGHTNPLYLRDDDPLRSEAAEIFKKHLPEGYNVHCTLDLDKQAAPYIKHEKEGMWFSKAAGYDYVFVIRILGMDQPEVIHFQHPRATFDIYEGGAELQSTMYSFHADTQYCFNVGRSCTGNVGESLEYVEHCALKLTLKAAAEWYQDVPIKRI